MDKENQPLIRSFSENNLYSPRDYEKAKRAGDLLNALGTIEIIKEATKNPIWDDAETSQNLHDPNSQIFIAIEAKPRVLIKRGKYWENPSIVVWSGNGHTAIGHTSDSLSIGWCDPLELVSFINKDGSKNCTYKNSLTTNVLYVLRQYSDGRKDFYNTSSTKPKTMSLSQWLTEQVSVATKDDFKIKKPSENDNNMTMLLHPILMFKARKSRRRISFEDSY